MKYNKEYSSPSELISILQSRGLDCSDILKHFVDIIWSNNSFKSNLIALLDKYPMVDIAAMGFPLNWQDEPLWSTQ